MQFHQQEDTEIQYLWILGKTWYFLTSSDQVKLNKTAPLLLQTLESDFLWYLLKKNIRIKSMAVEWGRPKMGNRNKE